MINFADRKYFYYGIVILIGLVAGILLLRAGLRATEPGQDAERLGEGTRESLPPTVKVMTPTITAPIYLLANESITTTEVWKSSPDDGQWSMLHSISKAIDKPEDVIIPPDEIERMENYIKTLSPPPDVPAGSLFKRYPVWLVLSPTIQQLAYVESYSFWATDNQQGQFGINHTGSFTLETGQSQSFFQVPIRVLVGEDYYGAGLGKPLWSPNGQYFSVDYDVSYNDTTPLIINVNTGVVQQLESAASFLDPLAWSPDSKTLILYLYRSGYEASGGVIRRCEIEPLSCRDIELEGVWFHVLGADWSPQRNQIVFSGADEDFIAFSHPPFGLYLFDPETDTVHKVIDNFDSTLENPRWSLDGRFIAVRSNDQTGTVASPSPPNTVVVIEPDSGQVITEIVVGGCDWQWEQSGQPIIQVLCNRIENSDLENFNIFDASSQTIVLPDDLQGKRRLGFNTLRLP